MIDDNPNQFTLGVDLGGTKVKSALVDNNGQILAVHKHPTHPNKGPAGVIKDIIACINGCLEKAKQEAQSLGIGVAGQVDSEGVVQFAPNLNWRNVPLREKLENQMGMPVVVINDVRAATLGEWYFGAGKGVEDLVVLFIGTGIGGGVISGGKMLIGCSKAAGELGHTTIVTGGRKCHCPNMGCLEAYVGGWGITERMQDAVRADPKAGEHLLSLAGNIDDLTVYTLSQAWQNGDPLAQHLVKETGHYLAAGVISIVNTFNPCLLVLGGGVIDGLPTLVSMVEKNTYKKALEAAVAPLKIVKATLGNDAPLIGAATLARTKIKDSSENPS